MNFKDNWKDVICKFSNILSKMTGVQIDSSFYVKKIQREQSSANDTANYIKQLCVITKQKEDKVIEIEISEDFDFGFGACMNFDECLEDKILKIPEDKVIEMEIPEDFDFDFGVCMNFDKCLEEKY